VNEHRLRYEGWRVVGACSVGAFCATIPLTVFGVFLPVMCDHFSWSRESASTAYGALTIGAAVSAPVVGRLVDRVGAPRVIAVCLAVSGCAVASLCLMTSSLAHFRGTFALIGLAMMGASPIAYSRAVFGWFDDHRGRALGVMLAGASASSIVLPPLAQALIHVADWRFSWLALGMLTLVLALPIAVTFIREHRPPRVETMSALPVMSAREALRSRALWTLVAVVFGSSLAFSGAAVHMVALLGDRGAPAAQAALSLSAMGAASLAGRLATGWLLDRFAAVRVSIAMLVIAAAGPFLLALAPSIGIGILAAICLGFGSGGETDVTPYLLSRYFGLRSLSTLYGLNWTAWGLAAAAGPVLMGRAFDTTGSYTTTLVGLGVLGLAAAGAMFTFPPIRRTEYVSS
jgi:MFS family permease